MVALLHRLGIEYRKPTVISRKLDPVKQAALYQEVMKASLNQLPADEVVMFGDAVHPTHAVRPVGCWSTERGAGWQWEQSSGRDRLNVHGAIDLETGKSAMRDVLTVDAVSTIMLLMAIEAMYPGKRLVHLFLDNARYHHAKLVQAWLARPECRIKLHFIPAYCPHLNPYRTTMGVDAQAHHPQQVLRQLQGFQHRNADLPARRSAEELGHLLRPSHGQLPNHQPKGFSRSHVNGVYTRQAQYGHQPRCTQR